MNVRTAEMADLVQVGTLLREYMLQTFQRAWFGLEEQLAQDLESGLLTLWVAELPRSRVIGFAGVTRAYDLHHCVSGAEVVDLYVARPHRGFGVAGALVCAIAADTMRRGGVFVKGTAVADPAVERLYRRVGLVFPGGDVIVGGRAFRQLASLAGKGPRALVEGLPDPQWNHE